MKATIDATHSILAVANLSVELRTPAALCPPFERSATSWRRGRPWPSWAATRAATEATKLLVDEEVAAIPISSFPFFFYGLASNVTGFDPHPSVNDLEWTDVQLVEE